MGNNRGGVSEKKCLTRFLRVRGFTLLELLLTISVIVIVGTFAWINLFQVGTHQELRNATLLIVGSLRDAQQRSISQLQGLYWGIRFEHVLGARDRYVLFSTTSPPRPGIPFSGATSSVVTLKGFVTFSDPTVAKASSTIVFQQLEGTPTSSFGFSLCPLSIASTTIRLSLMNDANASSTIRISCRGKIDF